MKCTYQRGNKKCQAYTMTDSEYCFTHNPVTKNRVVEAGRAGGSVGNEKGLVALDPLDLTDPKGVLILLADTINRIRRVYEDGSMNVKVANCIGFLASKIIDAQKNALFEERLRKLEEIISEKSHELSK